MWNRILKNPRSIPKRRRTGHRPRWSDRVIRKENKRQQSPGSLFIHSEVTIFYFFKCHSCIMGKEGVGWAVASTILITLELFYSTERIQRVAASPHWTTKVINRAINKIRTSRRKWNTRNDRDEIEKKKQKKKEKLGKKPHKYIISTLKHWM